MEEIMGFRKACKNWLLAHPPPLVEWVTDWRDQIMTFGYGDSKIRKQGHEHSLCGLAGAFSTRINVIVVTTSGHHIQQYNPPENIQHPQELWLIYRTSKIRVTIYPLSRIWPSVFPLLLLQPGEVQTETRQGLDERRVLRSRLTILLCQ